MSKTIDLDKRPCHTVQSGGIAGVGLGQFEVERDSGRGRPSKFRPVVVSDEKPSPAILTGGLSNANRSQYEIKRSEIKPPFRVPSMMEIKKIKWNGFTVATTFAGCGGSSAGWHMAGFRVVWANEMDDHAARCYELNSDIKVDRRDIRKVTAKDVLSATGLVAGELDVLDGSPPCQTFSTAGKRQMDDPRSNLFMEYARLLRGLRPRCFVAENVSGLVKGAAKGWFIDILKELKSCGYKVEARVLDAQWLGVPQCRRRVIFIGVREDLGLAPAFPLPLLYRYSVRDALPWIGAAVYENGGFKRDDGVASKPCGVITKRQTRLTMTRKAHGYFPGDEVDLGSRPMPTVNAGGVSGGSYVPIPKELCLDKSRRDAVAGNKRFGANGVARAGKPSPAVQTCAIDTVCAEERRKFTIAEVKRICAFPDDFRLDGSYAQQWARLGNAVPPVMMMRIAEAVRDKVLKPK